MNIYPSNTVDTFMWIGKVGFFDALYFDTGRHGLTPASNDWHIETLQKDLQK